MSDTTPILSLPIIQASQAQKHVTHNEAIVLLDVLVQLTVIDATLSIAPIILTEGNRYIIGPSATGVWAGKDAHVAWVQDGEWRYLTPQEGWRCYVTSTNETLHFDGTEWAADSFSTNNLDLLGVNSTADATNKLSVASDATLLTHNGSSHQLKINKASSGDTASMLYQSNWSGRAEFGLTGDDDFHVKTSADGSIWNETIVATGTGNVGIGKTPSAKLDVDGVMRLTPTLTADLPSAATIGAGALSFVSDATGGAQLAYSDGSSWLKVSSGTAI